MTGISFVLNGTPVSARADPPTRTLLDWLREARGLTGTKEGCAEGDCGACTVMVTGEDGTARPVNACILLLPQLHGRAVRTVEGLAAPDGALHPVQRAMVDNHGSQCGFCTPGFVVSMACAHLNGRRDHDDVLAGNLCRCTGYAPIIRAAEAAAGARVPEWMHDTAPRVPALTAGAELAMPESADDLAAWYLAHPDATLIAGATDVGLWVTKALRELSPVAFLGRCRDLARIEETDSEVRFGAMVTIAQLRAAVADRFPAWAELLRRYGSEQVRAVATLGGNVANASPIGDNPPVLIALGATLHLRGGDERRALPIEEFFLDYGKQDRRAGEFVEAISIPRPADPLFAWKLSKRFDQDISAVCGAFSIGIEAGHVARARIGFGGMAAIPKRARAVEAALQGKPWTEATIEAALPAFAEDFAPIDDMRASAGYRLRTARNMLRRAFHESRGTAVSVLELAR